MATGHDEARFVRIEQILTQQGEEIEEMGGTVDHLVNTVDTIVLPAQKRHAEKIEEQGAIARDAQEFMAFARGGWAFVMKAGVVIAAVSGLVTLSITIWRIYHPLLVH